MFCIKCGRALPDNTRFCAYCGTDLSSIVNNRFVPLNIQEPVKGLAIASMVLGIVSIVFISIVISILAIVFGVVAKNRGNKSPKATAGIVCGIVVIAIFVLRLIFAYWIGLSLAFLLF